MKRLFVTSLLLVISHIAVLQAAPTLPTTDVATSVEANVETQNDATAEANVETQNDATVEANEQTNEQAVSDSLQENEQHLIGKVITWYNSHLNYVSISLLMTLESSFIPFPSEIVVPPAAYQACNPENSVLYVTQWPIVNILLVLLFACLGALLGALINYFLSMWLGRPFVYWFADSKIGHLLMLSGEKVQKAEKYFVDHGNISTFIGRLIPGIRQLISIPAGLSKMKFGPFLLYTALGATSWNIVLALIGYLAQGNKELINQYSDELSHLIIILFVAFIAYMVIKSIRKKKKKTNPCTNSDSSDIQ